ncbi:hypothetical protein M1L60_17840 [Actinoplanes sp. TRM 88003]|uniref:Uncharacterized protein n=1 Tax=Paractinoplanes aksuensis TaxID=2939490 RepID=A0ABT1DNT9_9ACTN|nr:hypothetical protein [Actinoplanes aksuensis]MCO8272460.1 hypothetical protein [Actinoplanes aksuensis]
MTSAKEQEQDEPNEFGFAGGATAPEPVKEPAEGYGENIAVPAGDLTGAITEAIEEATERDKT